MMSVLCVATFWVVNASSGEKSCSQFSIPTGSGAGGEGGISHCLKYITSVLTPGNQKEFRAVCTGMGFLQFSRAFGECGIV